MIGNNNSQCMAAVRCRALILVCVYARGCTKLRAAPSEDGAPLSSEDGAPLRLTMIQTPRGATASNRTSQCPHHVSTRTPTMRMTSFGHTRTVWGVIAILATLALLASTLVIASAAEVEHSTSISLRCGLTPRRTDSRLHSEPNSGRYMTDWLTPCCMVLMEDDVRRLLSVHEFGMCGTVFSEQFFRTRPL
jgi:hypothetical protein